MEDGMVPHIHRSLPFGAAVDVKKTDEKNQIKKQISIHPSVGQKRKVVKREREMNNRAYQQWRNSTRSINKLVPKPTISSITVYISLLFTFSIIVFFFSSRQIPDNEDPDLSIPDDPQPQARQLPGQELWGAHTSGYHSCVDATPSYKEAQESNRYITVRSNGGLNQMRTGISDMVAVARIMNATLVIPQLDKKSFWSDSSSFSDIFDELHFMTFLQRDVHIVRELPKGLESVPRARKHFTSWSSESYYKEMNHLWNDYQVIHVAKSDSRLANNDLPLDIQRLRCRALYHALQFAPPIERLGKKLVERLRLREGKYIALHLRYEKDMLAFTGCTYGLTDTEAEELRIMRENTNHWKVKKINATEQRNEGFCPLTPQEVGIFLKMLGYPPSTLIYVAAGEIYGGEPRLSHLRSYFPNLVFKESVATVDELKVFANHASQTAALDYIVSVESDVFVPSYSGNMARAVEGHRRFLGHRKTITPDRKTLVEVFDKMERGEIQEGSVSDLVKKLHKNRRGGPRKRRGAPPGVKGRARFRTEEAFYENPYPECICRSKKHV